MRYGYFTHHPQEGIGVAKRHDRVHASQGLDMEALCGWEFVGQADPKLTKTPKKLGELLAEVTCVRCVREILGFETGPSPFGGSGCRNCGAPEGEPCRHDAGCVDSDRSSGGVSWAT
jgi:hypothetical protein